jgi:hypothetical protein
MSASEIDLAVQDYTANVQLLLQRHGSKFRAHVMDTGRYVGKAGQVVDQVGSVTATRVIGKFTPIGRTDVTNDQRWVYPVDYEVKPQMIDSFDKLRLKCSLEGPYTQNAAMALGRAEDDEIITAFFADAKTGVDGGTTTAFGTTVTTSGGRNVAVATGGASATGLNVKKLREAKRKLLASHVDPKVDRLKIAVGSTQEDNLLGDVQVTSGEFGWKDAPVLKEGKVERFLGFDFIQDEGLQNGTDDASSTSRQIPAWAQSGMHFGIWGEAQHRMNERPDITGVPWQVYSTETCGATRTEENKIVRIWCYEG